MARVLVFPSAHLHRGADALCKGRTEPSLKSAHKLPRWKIIWEGPTSRRDEVLYTATCPEHTNDSDG